MQYSCVRAAAPGSDTGSVPPPTASTRRSGSPRIRLRTSTAIPTISSSGESELFNRSAKAPVIMVSRSATASETSSSREPKME